MMKKLKKEFYKKKILNINNNFKRQQTFLIEINYKKKWNSMKKLKF